MDARGFTLIELIVAIAIGAILATIAVPGFTSLIADQRAKAASSELFESLLTARSEAITRNASVSLTPVAGGWDGGWQVLDPANQSNVLDDHGAVTGVVIQGPTAAVTYEASGRLLAGTAPVFLVTATAGSAVFSQCLSVDLTGRPYLVEGTTC